MDFPAPGEPMSRMLCPPAAAISRARFTFSCPMTSEKSGPDSAPGSGVQGAAGGIFFRFRRWDKSSSSILPDMTRREALEATEIWSVAGMTDRKHPLLLRRPFRSPHHTVSAVALAGGGAFPRPGEGNFFPVSEVGQKLLHGLHGVDGQALGQRGLGGVFRRDVELLHARPGGGHGHGEHPGDGAQGAGQGQLPHEGGPFVRGIDVALGGQDAQEDGEIVDGALQGSGGGQPTGQFKKNVPFAPAGREERTPLW